MAEKLVALGADLEARDLYGNSALHHAVEFGQEVSSGLKVSVSGFEVMSEGLT
jgi:ankyrin repeat protein